MSVQVKMILFEAGSEENLSAPEGVAVPNSEGWEVMDLDWYGGRRWMVAWMQREVPTTGRSKMPHRGEHVNYVHQTGMDAEIAHVLEDQGGTQLVLQRGNGEVVGPFPRRDPADYDQEGGGQTWHLLIP